MSLCVRLFHQKFEREFSLGTLRLARLALFTFSAARGALTSKSMHLSPPLRQGFLIAMLLVPLLIGPNQRISGAVAHWCDTYGGKASAVGYGKRSGDSIEFEFQYPD